MLRDFTKADWLSLLAIPKEQVPHVLLLRGTRNLKGQYEHHQRYFTNVREVGSPNGFLEDVFLADLGGLPIAYASVYGSPLTSEIVHLFGVLGTRLVIQTGCWWRRAKTYARSKNSWATAMSPRRRSTTSTAGRRRKALPTMCRFEYRVALPAG